MKTIRRYRLPSTETQGSATSYSLIFTDSGRMYVQARTQYEQDYKTDAVWDISPETFSQHVVGGVLLSELVGKKLDELLPPKPLEWPDVPHYG